MYFGVLQFMHSVSVITHVSHISPHGRHESLVSLRYWPSGHVVSSVHSPSIRSLSSSQPVQSILVPPEHVRQDSSQLTHVGSSKYIPSNHTQNSLNTSAFYIQFEHFSRLVHSVQIVGHCKQL